MVDQPLRDPDPSTSIDIVEEHGSFLLIRAASGFAVVERRNGRIYSMKPGKREGITMTANAVTALLAEEGCFSESARNAYSTSSAIGAITWLGLSGESSIRLCAANILSILGIDGRCFGGSQPSPLARAVICLDPVSVRIDNKGGIVIGVVTPDQVSVAAVLTALGGTSGEQ